MASCVHRYDYFCVMLSLSAHVDVDGISQIGWKALKDDIARMGADDPFTALVWPLTGQDPDEAFSRVPYEKVLDSILN
jgi:hypothetical protein